MMKPKSEMVLRAIADNIAQTIYIRDKNKGDYRRGTTQEEHDIIEKIVLATLIEINISTVCRRDSITADAVIRTAEGVLDQFIPSCNGYMTLFIPVANKIDDWLHEKQEI